MVETAEIPTTTVETNKTNEATKPTQYNPRWRGYTYIAFWSLVCFSSVSNVKRTHQEAAICIAFGVIIFTASMIILLLDRFPCFSDTFQYHKSMGGKVEGATILFFVIMSGVGVCIMTHTNGIAYKANNIYFSSWLTFFSCCYTLNEWSGSKDIITIQELTALSGTLRGWYCLLFSSIVVMGSASDIYANLSRNGPKDEALFAVFLGIISLVMAFSFILAYYRVFAFIPVGGLTELGFTIMMTLLWIIGVGTLTQDQSVAASITGQCAEKDHNSNTPLIPGSNLYVFSWLCLVSVFDIALCWKATQAIAFAQAANKENSENPNENDDGDDEALDVDDEEDDDP